MARKVSGNTNASKKTSKPKKTSIGRGFHSKCMMNKHKRRSYKKYRGQGRQCQALHVEIQTLPSALRLKEVKMFL